MRRRRFVPVRVMDLELSGPISDVEGLYGFERARILLRHLGEPVAEIELPVEGDRILADHIVSAASRRRGEALVRHLLGRALRQGIPPDSWGVEELLRIAPSPPPAELPPMTVAVCTRDRVRQLERCIQALQALCYPGQLELLVVDNAPSSDDSERMLRERFPTVRYVRELRPGLDWARNRAVREARTELLAFTDDDVTVDVGWAAALGALLADDPAVMAVTGLVLPFELETRAQELFELYGGFGRGFVRRWWGPTWSARRPDHHGAGVIGTGASMAFRRSIFDRIGLFDPALDVGTPTNGGGDLDLLFRVVEEGYVVVYEPAALVRHHHRLSLDDLRRQVEGWGSGTVSFVIRNWRRYPGARSGFRRMAWWYATRWYPRQLIGSFLRPDRNRRTLILAELYGALRGIGRYDASVLRAAEIAEDFGEPVPSEPAAPRGPVEPLADADLDQEEHVVELGRPILPRRRTGRPLRIRLVVTWMGRPVALRFTRAGPEGLSASRLLDLVVEMLLPKLHMSESHMGSCATGALLEEALGRRVAGAGHSGGPVSATSHPVGTSSGVRTVSVIVSTFDRPSALARCLEGLARQETSREVEVIVVDNHPDSGRTAPTVARFQGVRLLAEERQGLSYARNRGLRAAGGEILVVTDDDVLLPPDWLECLLAPFSRDEVMAVTGNVLPAEFATPAQELFEEYGGLGRGFQRFEVGPEWAASFRFQPVPTWLLGATANAAFRASILSDPAVGLFDEALGAGTPTGCSEDSEYLYRILAAGYRIVYEPRACVWHEHRREMRALRSQIFQYSKGHVAHHLTIFGRFGDRRGLLHLLVFLPRWYAKQCWRLLRRRTPRPAWMVLTEIRGWLAGPWGLWRSRLRVRRLRETAD